VYETSNPRDKHVGELFPVSTTAQFSVLDSRFWSFIIQTNPHSQEPRNKQATIDPR
jgi:hypothetical protein